MPRPKRQVICVETGKIYSEINEAAVDMGVTYQYMGNVLTKRGYCKTAKGYHFEYYTKPEVNED